MAAAGHSAQDVGTEKLQKQAVIINKSKCFRTIHAAAGGSSEVLAGGRGQKPAVDTF